MTDNEIIKALECCTDESYENCNECPYSIDTLSCERIKLLEDSLDLINRQQAEIEQWKEEANRYQNLWCIATDDIFKAKSEAIKEFAEKLKNKIKTECNPYGKPTFDYDTSVSIMHYIDNLVKEIVSDKE